MAYRTDFDKVSFGQWILNPSGREIRYLPKGKGFDILEMSENTDNGTVFYAVETVRLGKTVVFTVAKEDVIKGGYELLQYGKKGLDVNASNLKLVAEVFQLKEDEFVQNNGTINLLHSQAGIKVCEDAAGNDFVSFAGYYNPANGSRYVGHFDLEPKGSAEEWLAFAKTEAKESIPIQFVLSLSIAAMLTALLKGKVDCDNLVCHLRGDSSSGKTTMLSLAISVYGNPDEKCPNGLISSWNGTKNALLRRLMDVNGLLLGLDEFSMLQDRDVSGLIYSIASGIEKDRMNRDATLRERLTGTYILLSTGEASIKNRCNGNIGLSMRILELDSQKWTDSAEQAERIKKFVKSNYGHFGVEFGYKLGMWLQEHDMDELISMYEAWRIYYCENCIVQARRERMSGRYAMILLAAELMNLFFDMGFDVERICSFLIENEAAGEDDHDSYDSFYDKLSALIIANRSEHFFQKDAWNRDKHSKEEYQGIGATKTEWGIIEEAERPIPIDDGFANEIVLIRIPFFDEIVTKRLHYEDPKALRKFLKSKGYTKCEEDRDFLRKSYRGNREKFVALYLMGDSPKEDKEAEYQEKQLQKMEEERIKKNNVELSKAILLLDKILRGRARGDVHELMATIEELEADATGINKKGIDKVREMYTKAMETSGDTELSDLYDEDSEERIKKTFEKVRTAETADQLDDALYEMKPYEWQLDKSETTEVREARIKLKKYKEKEKVLVAKKAAEKSEKLTFAEIDAKSKELFPKKDKKLSDEEDTEPKEIVKDGHRIKYLQSGPSAIDLMDDMEEFTED